MISSQEGNLRKEGGMRKRHSRCKQGNNVHNGIIAHSVETRRHRLKQEAHCVSSLYANTFMLTDNAH